MSSFPQLFSVIALVFINSFNGVSNKFSDPFYLLCSNHVQYGSCYKHFILIVIFKSDRIKHETFLLRILIEVLHY
jgi:hypothetical protein